MEINIKWLINSLHTARRAKYEADVEQNPVQSDYQKTSMGIQ
jgi:hypothetical protein